MSNKETLKRIVVIGNSGSGKTFLAQQLANILNTEIIHFDKHFWEPGGFNKKRPPDVVHAEILTLSKNDVWIMEGVFGDLAATALPQATALIFLCKSWDECKTALMHRGSESSTQLDAVEAENNFNELIAWAQAYWDRENSRSLKGHQLLFDEFQGWKLLISDRDGSQKFLQDIGSFST